MVWVRQKTQKFSKPVESVSHEVNIPDSITVADFANPNSVVGDGTATCFVVGGEVPTFQAELGFVTDAFPSRESLSFYGQTTYNFSDDLRLVSGLRYTDDAFATSVGNFFAFETNGTIFTEDESAEEVTGKATIEYDFQDET